MKRLISIFLVVSSVATDCFSQDDSPTLNLDVKDVARNRTRPDRHALNTIFHEEFIAENSLAVHRRADKLPAEQRYRYLGKWVLPNENHPTIRLEGDFTATHPAPVVPIENDIDVMRIQNANQSGQSRVQVGGNLIAPAFDLIRVAKELGRLDELRMRIEKAPAKTEQQQRSRFAMLMLVDLARGDAKNAITQLEKQMAIMEEVTSYPLDSRWPEMLALWTGIRNPATRELAGDFLDSIWGRQLQTWKYTGVEPWELQIRTLAGLKKHLGSGETDIERFTSDPSLKQWSPVSYTSARSRGDGLPRAHWQSNKHRVDTFSGHEQDYLLYHIPLRGNYEVECEVTSFHQIHLMVAGTYVADFRDLKSYQSGNFQGGRKKHEIVPQLARQDEWIRYRVVVRDGSTTTYLNGRLVHQETLPEHHEPWLAIRSWHRFHGGVRDLRITGTPDVPEQIKLSALPDLPGWVPYYNGSVGQTVSSWRQLGDLSNGGGIVGRRNIDLPDSCLERLIRYHRPMLEDGTIKYEFYYLPGEAQTHPALDRLAFMLEPAGVRLHWITDGKHDRTGLAPTNVFDEPENRLGPKQLPLKPNAWNTLQLKLTGNIVDLILNGQPVYRRKLEPTNQRTFGLFHYADRGEARVRNVVWKGDWPRELPSVQDQELAGEGLQFLEEKLPELTSVFEHDFARDGLPDEYFHQYERDEDSLISVRADGIHIVRPGTGKWSHTAFAQKFRVLGDFDITATFDQLQTQLPETQPPENCTVRMGVYMQDESKRVFLISRLHLSSGKRIQGSVQETKPGEHPRGWGKHESNEADSGRLRLVRRGDKIFFLYSEGDSPNFRLITTETVGPDEIMTNGLRLSAITNGTGSTSVVWKKLSIRAEKMLHMPIRSEPAKRWLYIMDTDGKKLRQLTESFEDLGSHGSPVWSSDGKQIAFDAHKASIANSHICIVNSDGTEIKDLGLGCMPTFSPDGKRIAFSQSGQGVGVMNSDGTDRQILDPRGWGAQLSPNGKSIAYGVGGNIAVLDVNTNEQRMILEEDQAMRYSYVNWNMGWSKDSKRICFKARNRTNQNYEIAVTEVTGSSNGFDVLYENKGPTYSKMSWHPDGKRIMFSMNDPARFFTLDCENPGPPLLVPGQPEEFNNMDGDWSRDGEQIVFAAQRLPTWEEWPGTTELKSLDSVPNP